MKQAQGGTAGKHQCRAAIGEPDFPEEFQFLTVAKLIFVTVRQVLQRRADLVHVLVNQRLGADQWRFVDRGVADIAQIPVQALTQVMQQLGRRTVLSKLANLPHARANQTPVVVRRGFDLLPVIQAQTPLQHQGRVTPGVVVIGVTHGLRRLSCNPVQRGLPEGILSGQPLC